ncbi:type I toxin-antitoxin system SymE family toxin [Gilliamella sp. ESL0405]|nr:type I toxin-antitoxin system SymE family toxin [Gilliamella sp. ESL0405]
MVIMIKMHFYAKINPRPQLTIKGRWLEQIGFYVGCPVIIKIEQGKLVVELAMQI